MYDDRIGGTVGLLGCSAMRRCGCLLLLLALAACGEATREPTVLCTRLGDNGVAELGDGRKVALAGLGEMLEPGAARALVEGKSVSVREGQAERKIKLRLR